jgi:phage-related protein
MASILVEILGNAKQFKSELDSAVASTEKANTGLGKMQRVAGAAGLAIAGGLAVGLTKSVDAAEEAQQVTARMNAAFAASGVSAKNFAGKIEETESSSRKLGFTNDQVRTSLGSLVIATHDGNKAITDLGVAEDISRFKHTSLEASTKMLTMAMTGSSRAAKQLGIDVPKVTTAQDALKASGNALKAQIVDQHAVILKLRDAHDKSAAGVKSLHDAEATLAIMEQHAREATLSHTSAAYQAEVANAKLQDRMSTGNAVIDAVSQKLHGQAQAYSQTAAGGMAQFHAQMGAMEESIGSALIPAITMLSQDMASLAGFFASHTETTKILVVGLGILAATLLAVSAVTKVVAAAQAIATGATKAYEAAQWLLNAALDANPIGVVVIALGVLTAAIIVAYQHSATFRQIVGGAFDAVKTAANAVLGFFRDNWPVIATLMAGPFAPLVALATNAFGIRSALVDAGNAIVGFFRDNWQTIAVVITGPFAPLVALATNAFGIRSELVGAFDAMSTHVQNVIGSIVLFVAGIPHRFLTALGDTSKLLYNAGAAIIDGLWNGISSKLSALKNGVTGIAHKIASWKGPEDDDRVLLVPHGQAMIDGLMSGIASSLPDLERLTSGIAPQISANVSGGASVAAPITASGGGGTTINITVNGWVGSDQQIAEKLRNELIRLGRNTTGGVLGGFA